MTGHPPSFRCNGRNWMAADDLCPLSETNAIIHNAQSKRNWSFMTERVPNDPAGEAGALAAASQPLCELCGSAGELRYPDLQDRHFDAPGTWTELQCPRCQLIWLNPKPTAADLPALYADYYTHGEPDERSVFVQAILCGVPAATQDYADMVSDPWVRRLGRAFSLFGPLREMGMRGTMGLSRDAGISLLDFGCGDGAFLRHMRSLGWTVSGVEQDPRAAEVARQLIGQESIHTSIDDARAKAPDGYDVITLSHVIEHLLDPIGTLQECASALRPGGKLVITTPNTESRGHRYFQRNWLHLDPPRHITLYNPGTLTDLARRAGFKVERVETPASSSHFVYQASIQLELHGSLPGIRVENLSTMTLLESGLFWMWEYTLTRFGTKCGEELLLTAVRPV
jgi:SAM-dependent methyltransferase